jgi:hypothetical protein
MDDGGARIAAYTDHEEATTTAATVVAAGHVAEHDGRVGNVRDAGRWQVRPDIGDWVPHDEAPAAAARLLEENAAVAAVEGPRDAAVVEPAEGEREGFWRGGDEGREGPREIEVVEEAEQWRRRALVEGTVAAEEAVVGEDAVPALVGEQWPSQEICIGGRSKSFDI